MRELLDAELREFGFGLLLGVGVSVFYILEALLDFLDDVDVILNVVECAVVG